MTKREWLLGKNETTGLPMWKLALPFTQTWGCYHTFKKEFPIIRSADIWEAVQDTEYAFEFQALMLDLED